MSMIDPRAVMLNGLQGPLPGRLVASQDDGEHAVALFPATNAGRRLRLAIDPGGIEEVAILQMTLGGRIAGGLRVDFANGQLSRTGGSTGTLERDGDCWTIEMDTAATATAYYFSLMLVRDGSTVFAGTEDDAVTVHALSIDDRAIVLADGRTAAAHDLAVSRRPFVLQDDQVDAGGGAAISYRWPLTSAPDMHVNVIRNGDEVAVRFEAQSDVFRAQFGENDFVLRVENNDEDWFLTEFRRRLSRQRAASAHNDVQRFYGNMIAKLRPLFAGVIIADRADHADRA